MDVHIKATVRAGSKRDEIVIKNGRYIVSVREPAQEGRANKAAQAMLAQHLGVPEKDLALVRGSDRPSKLFVRKDI